ncbi:unnamed protein product, partial [Rotaria sp. Silwood1]
MLGAILGWTAIQQLLKYWRTNENEVRFDNAEDAKQFITDITELINKLSTGIYNTIEKEVSDTCEKSRKQFDSMISERIVKILDRANQRLHDTFDVNLVVPKKVALELKIIHLDVHDIGHTQQYQPNFIRRLFTKDTADNHDVWILSRSEIQEKCAESVIANLNRICTDIIESTNARMTQNFTALVNNLQAYLM